MQRVEPSVSAAALPLDERALAQHLVGRLPGFGGGEVRASKFAGGQSNPTYRLQAGEQTFVLRKKPPGALLPTAHMIDREFRVFRALCDTAVPVPRPLYYCADTQIIGTEFFVMEHVSGRILWDPTLPALAADERAAIYEEMTRVLAALHRVDYTARGLADYGKSGNYFERQIRRWSQQYAASATEPVAAMDELCAWLPHNIPADDATTLVHGDYRIDNLIFHATEPRVIAVLDWELSTLGHPLADLAYYCMPIYLGSPGRPALGVGGGIPGIPAQRELIARYCEHVGRDGISGLPFYLAFSLFRYASIVSGVYRRGLDGNASSGADAMQYRERMIAAAQAAVTLLAGEAVDAR